MKKFVSKAQIGLIGFVLSLLLAACNGLVPVNAPTPTSTTPTAIVPQKIAQEEPLPNMSGAIRFESLGLEDGLSQSTVLAILQDQFGFLWIGTEDGLNRYNGYTFEIFRPDLNNPDTISDRWITSLFEDRQGYIWIGTRQGGLNRYDPATGKFTYYLHDPKDPQSLSSNNVTAILENKKGELWVGTNNGLNLLDRQTGEFQRFNSDPDVSTTISSNLITALFEDSRGILWIGTDDGRLNRFNSATKNFTSYVYNPKNYSVVKGKSIKSIVEDRNGDLWIASFEGLQHFKPSESSFNAFKHSKTEPSSLISDTVLSLYMDRSDTLWVGTNEGLDRFNPKTNSFVHYQHDPSDRTSLSNNTVLSIREDRGGVLWIGTFGGGLNKFNKGQRKFAYYHYEPSNPNSLSANYISPIFADSSGHIWIGTYGGGLNRFNPSMGLFTHYTHDPRNLSSLPSNDIYSVYVDKTGTLWVGTADALSRRNPSSVSFTHYRNDPTDPESLAGGPVRMIFQDSRGSLWIGTSNGLDLLDPSTGKFTHYQHSLTKPNSISSDDITAIYEDKDGTLWIGTFDNGLNRFNRDTGAFVRYQRNRGDPQSLSDDSVTAIYQDQNNNLWIATAGGGLNLYHPETNSFQHYTENNGLPNNVIYGILEDDAGQLWLSTNYGLSRFDPERGTFRNYTDSDGLQSNEFNMGAYAKGLDNKMYFGGINGLNAFFPDEVKNNTYAPPVILTSFTPGGQPDSGLPQAEELRQVTLGWPNNNFGFEIAALSFAEPGRNQYAYKLEGFDKDWNYVGTSREGRYTNLAGGTYTLRFMGTNNDGVWNESNQVIQITVIPPFWETWAFRILVTISIIVLGVVAYRLRVHSIQSQNLQLELTVRERTSALRKRTEELEALYSGDEKIIRAITLDQVFKAIVAVAVNMLHADRGAVFVWDEKQMQVVPRVSHGFMPETLQVLHFGKGEGMIGEVLETGIPLIVTELDPATLRPDIRVAIIAEGIHSILNLPIKVNEQTLGVFNVGFTRPGAITEDTARLYTALIQRAALSVENMQLFEQTKELAVIEERNRVARDLHDSAKQKAFAALAQLGAVSGILKNDPNNAWSHLSEAENLVYEVIQELTFLIQEMYPMALKEKGLATTLREYVFEWENRNGVMINLAIQNARRMPLETEQAIYRMIQEALANVARHSQANSVNVSLDYNSEAVTLTVEDNGLGFDVKHKAGGMGLRIINERAKSIGGQACVESEPGKGTKIMITAPLNGHV
jgi:ligand-binding sensor domain-containing protein/signal transduction histidine kinase